MRRQRPWELAERDATPECAFLDRRAFLRRAGALATGAAFGVAGCARSEGRSEPRADRKLARGPEPGSSSDSDALGLDPAARNPDYVLDQPLTDETVAARYNNFYEFTTDKERVWRLSGQMKTRPWTVEIGGLVLRPKTWDIDALIRRFPLEERLYRHRCVERWAMAVPWAGFPFRALVRAAEPLSSARFVRLVSAADPPSMPGIGAQPGWPWPYHEGLTIAEASHELALLATGIYGHRLPNQHGAPIRAVLPWKYGFKSIKSLVRIEFTEHRPATFWSTASPREYGFYANVNPEVPHPRWPQHTERLIGTDVERPTRIYNGYAAQVANLYRGLQGHFF